MKGTSHWWPFLLCKLAGPVMLSSESSTIKPPPVYFFAISLHFCWSRGSAVNTTAVWSAGIVEIPRPRTRGPDRPGRAGVIGDDSSGHCVHGACMVFVCKSHDFTIHAYRTGMVPLTKCEGSCLVKVQPLNFSKRKQTVELQKNCTRWKYVTQFPNIALLVVIGNEPKQSLLVLFSRFALRNRFLESSARHPCRTRSNFCCARQTPRRDGEEVWTISWHDRLVFGLHANRHTLYLGWEYFQFLWGVLAVRVLTCRRLCILAFLAYAPRAGAATIGNTVTLPLLNLSF